MSRIHAVRMEADADVPLSAAVRAGAVIFLSGQVALDPATGQLVEGGVDAQVDQIFANLSEVLARLGKTLDAVVRVGVYLTDMSMLPAVNAAYARHFSAPYPARTAIGVAALPLGARIEIDAVAC